MLFCKNYWFFFADQTTEETGKGKQNETAWFATQKVGSYVQRNWTTESDTWEDERARYYFREEEEVIQGLAKHFPFGYSCLGPFVFIHRLLFAGKAAYFSPRNCLDGLGLCVEVMPISVCPRNERWAVKGEYFALGSGGEEEERHHRPITTLSFHIVGVSLVYWNVKMSVIFQIFKKIEISVTKTKAEIAELNEKLLKMKTDMEAKATADSLNSSNGAAETGIGVKRTFSEGWLSKWRTFQLKNKG